MLSKINQKALNGVALRLSIPSARLYALISFESNFNPFAKNPKSSARGLIQFINKTARGLGYKSSLDLVERNPTIKSQLEGPVYEYLRKYKPFPTSQSLFMSVFYPDARYWHPKKIFPYIPVRRDNPGINNPSDYVRKVYGKKKLTNFTPLIILLIIGSAVYYHITIKERGKYVTKNKKDRKERKATTTGAK